MFLPTSRRTPFARFGHLLVAWGLLCCGGAAAAAAKQPPKRIAFHEFADQLQRDTCRALYGELADDPGWSCMQHDLLSTYRTDVDEHRADVQLCGSEGGVLTERIPACTEAMVHYVCISAQYDEESLLTPLMEAFAAVSSRCWGQWLCVE